MTNPRALIMINPIRVKGGTANYIKMLTSKLNGIYDRIAILSPSPLPINIEKVKVYTFNTYCGIGALFLGINPSYLSNLLKVLRQFSKELGKSNLEVAIALNTPFGALSVYVLAKLLGIRDLIYISHNIERERYRSGGVSVQELKIVKILRYFVEFFEYIAMKYPKIITISKEDKRKLARIYSIPLDKIQVVPPYAYDENQQVYNSPNHQSSEAPKKKPPILRIVFHGTYDYYPNREAIMLIQEYISKKIGYGAQFVVFGKGVPHFQKGNFVSVGYVRNLEKFLETCDLAIMPLQRGGGVKIKAIDYIKAGIPIVTTKIGAEGLPLVHGKNSIITENVDDTFVEWIKYLIENPKIRKKLKKNILKTATKLSE